MCILLNLCISTNNYTNLSLNLYKHFLKIKYFSKYFFNSMDLNFKKYISRKFFN